jgi:hypothetical protein|tara:strand:- start:1748 stop:2062 length:315 start_codon:yes stop_codon:yes gene_type:complete
MIELVSERLDLGKSKYGHGVCTHMDTTTWGTPKDSWIEMAIEEYLDAIVYTVADYIRKFEEPSQPDDNERILELAKNPVHMLSECHMKIINMLKNLVVVSLAIK